MATSPEVPPRVLQLVTELAQPQPMRRGSVSQRSIKCGKAVCACHKDPKARHGPYDSLTQAVAGKTRSRFLTVEQASVAQQQNCRRAQNFANSSIPTGGPAKEWADGQLADVAAPSGGGQKKRAPSEPPGRHPPGNRKTLLGHQAVQDLDFEALEISGAAAGFAAGCASIGTTAECRYQRSCGSGSALLLRSTGPVSWPSDVRKACWALCIWSGAYYHCAPMRKRILPT